MKMKDKLVTCVCMMSALSLWLLVFWLLVVRIISIEAFLSQGSPGPPSKEGNESGMDREL